MHNRQTRAIAVPLLLISLLIAPAVASPGQGANEWILVAPAGEGFSVRLPVKPEEQTERVPLMGNTYQMRLYTSVPEHSGLLYMVMMQEFPDIAGVLEPSARLERFMNGFKEGFAKSMSSVPGARFELVPERDLNLKDHVGRQYTLSFGETRGLVRAFDGNPRMYVLVVMGADEKNPSVGRFFDSFEIKAAPPPVPKPISETKPS
jgi:hypothetical protein